MKIKYMIGFVAILLIVIGAGLIFKTLNMPSLIVMDDLNYSYNVTYRSNVMGVNLDPGLDFGLLSRGMGFNKNIIITLKKNMTFYDYSLSDDTDPIYIKCPENLTANKNNSCKVTLDLKNFDKPYGYYEGKIKIRLKR